MVQGAIVPELAGVSGVNVPTLLDAIAMVEVSGCETGLRCEPSYLERNFRVSFQGRPMIGTGEWYRAEVIEAANEWGRTLAACGVSRWQIQASECWRFGYRGPFHDLLSDEVVLPFVYKKREIARTFVTRKPPLTPTVELIAEAWNTGSAFDAIRNLDYQRKVRAAYDALSHGR